MEVRLTSPEDVLEALGPDPERRALEGILLLLAGKGRLSLVRAGQILGLGDREEVVRWYVGRTLPRREPVGEGPGAIEIVHLEDLSQKEFDRLDRFLAIPPAERGSGLCDVSINHDEYLYDDA